MSHYHDENDLQLLKELSKLSREEFNARFSLDKVDRRDDGRFQEIIVSSSIGEDGWMRGTSMWMARGAPLFDGCFKEGIFASGRGFEALPPMLSCLIITL